MNSPLRTQDQFIEFDTLTGKAVTPESPTTGPTRRIRVMQTGWLAHDGKRARARRLKQMAKGTLPALCIKCGQPIPAGCVTPLCDDCLEEKWGS